MSKKLRQGSLVLYKHKPARVASMGEKKLTIKLADESLSVRPKDVDVLHPGPLEDLDNLEPQDGEVKVAWELLSGRTTTLAELAELAYGAFTPATAWAAWQWVADGLYFEGMPDEIKAHSPEAVAEEKASREARAAEKRAWEAFLERAQNGEMAPEDERYLLEVERLALEQRDQSRVLEELGRSENPETAHALLLELGYWDYTDVPYPERFDLPTAPPAMTLPDLPEESRRDLTHLPAFAIDDEGSQDPDDALSLEQSAEGQRLWVHIADVAALVPPDSEADQEARARGATLYLPDGKVPMLPPQAAQKLGMGLDDVSPALSFGLDLTPDGMVKDVEVVLSWVQVTRLTYREAESRLDEEPLAGLHQLAQAYEERRQANDAINIDLPEVKLRIEEGRVTVRPLPSLRSRALVREAMLMTGEAVARLALEEDIPIAFATQDEPDTDERPDGPDDLAGMFNLVRKLHRSEHSSAPAPHAGLGLPLYTRATSPLRRYLDLVVHQQLRAYLRGDDLLERQEVMRRIGAAEAVEGGVRRAERLSREHWKLVYLQQHPDWRGDAVLVDRWDRRGKAIIPALALETSINLREDLPLNSELTLSVSDVSLPNLEAYFRIV
jgi:exoribonuclease-2